MFLFACEQTRQDLKQQNAILERRVAEERRARSLLEAQVEKLDSQSPTHTRNSKCVAHSFLFFSFWLFILFNYVTSVEYCTGVLYYAVLYYAGLWCGLFAYERAFVMCHFVGHCQ